MMKKEKIELIQLLNKTNDWIPSASLAKMIGVSERTIRNYVTQLNTSGEVEIISSKNGYKLLEYESLVIKNNHAELEERVYFILSKLLSSKDGSSVFELAEELLISESTVLNNTIPKIKEMIIPFHLSIESHNYTLFLNGVEQDKRKLIGYLVTHNNYGYFTSDATLEKLFPSFHIQEVMHGLYTVCESSHLFINNFALNNLLVHILIILIRLEAKESLHPAEEENDIQNLLDGFTQKDEIIELANQISTFFQQHFHATIPEKDYRQILLLILLSVNHGFDSLHNVIETDFINSITSLVHQISKRYSIPEFDNEFISQFTLHMYHARERSQFQLSYPNPIASQIKKDYAPIYDMAVYFAHNFSNRFHVALNEDEIAFIAFHIGSYLENNQNYQSINTCIIIVEDYLNFSKKIVQDLEKSFHDDLMILNVISLDQYAITQPPCDLLITTIESDIPHSHKITINPFLTKQNIQMIKNELELLEEERKIKKAQLFLKNLFHKPLYFRNIQLHSPEEYIEFMGKKCRECNFIQPDFIKDVLLRETVSSTAFTDYLAVPHAISQFAEHSFICVIHNDTAIEWTKNKVNFILMIGISEHEMKYFNEAFDLLIELFLSHDKLVKILNTNSFEDFVNTIY